MNLPNFIFLFTPTGQNKLAQNGSTYFTKPWYSKGVIFATATVKCGRDENMHAFIYKVVSIKCRLNHTRALGTRSLQRSEANISAFVLTYNWAQAPSKLPHLSYFSELAGSIGARAPEK